MLSLPLPVHYHPDLTHDLTHDRLSIIAKILLDEYYKTLDDLSSDADDNYTRGCTSFGRQKNRIMLLALDNTYPWLQLMNSANDLVFKIGSVPCRFTNDDPNNPKKKAILIANSYQRSFFDDIETDEAPCRYCFIIDRGVDDTEPSVVFIGFDSKDVARCKWESGEIRTFYNVNTFDIPEAVDVGKPAVKLKKTTAETADETNRL